MNFHKSLLTYIACVGLTACGVTASNGTPGDTYVSFASDPAGGGGHTTAANGNIASTTTGGTLGTTTSGGNGNITAATTGGTNTGSSTSGATTAGTTTSGTTTPTYTVDNLTTDMNAVLQQHTPIAPDNQNLGNPANFDLWTPSALQSLYNGVTAAQAYYPSLSLQDLAHLMLALGATLSTGDYTISNSSSVGYLQVAIGSCQADYTNHGLAISGPSGQLISPTSITLTDPGANVAIMAWYTRNAASSGESANEASQNQVNHVIVHDVGNAVLAWLAGPGQDRHALVSGSDAANRWPAFYSRVEDYYVQAGFGTAASFDAIMDSALPATLQGFKDGPTTAFP